MRPATFWPRRARSSTSRPLGLSLNWFGTISLLTHRTKPDPGAGEVLTDDFAPVDVYVADGPQWKKGDDR